MGKFWAGFFSAIGVIVVAFGIMIIGGFTPVAATWMDHQHGLKAFLAYTARRSIEQSAGSRPNPFANNLAAMREGVKHYKEDCIHCHGAPGVKPDDWSKGMEPNPPDFEKEEFQKEFSASEIFWTAKHGIHSTGMPSFDHDKDEEIWQIVTLVKSFPNLPADIKKELTTHEGHEASHEGGQEGGESG